MIEHKRRRFWLLPIPAVLVVAALSGLLVLQIQSGVRVTIQNTGSSALKSVVMHVSGAGFQDVTFIKTTGYHTSPETEGAIFRATKPAS